MSNKTKRKASDGKKRPSPVAQPGDSPGVDTRTWLIRGAGLIVVVAVVAFFIGTESGKRSVEPSGTETFAATDREHTSEAIAYEINPPPGGDHNPVWANCGFYSTPIPTENVLHSMEHGAVWLSYHSDLPEDQIDKIRDLARKTDVIASPLDDQAEPVVATAWGKQLRLDTAFDDRLDDFVSAFRKGPQAPEPGGACTGGVGNPDA